MNLILKQKKKKITDESWPGSDEFGMSPDTIGSFLEASNWHFIGTSDEDVTKYRSSNGNTVVELSDYYWSWKNKKLSKRGSTTKEFFNFVRSLKK